MVKHVDPANIVANEYISLADNLCPRSASGNTMLLWQFIVNAHVQCHGNDDASPKEASESGQPAYWRCPGYCPHTPKSEGQQTSQPCI